MSLMARALATGAGLLIIATTVSFVPSNEWWIRVLDFPRLQIAVALAIVLAACVVLVNRGRWRTILIAGLACALVAQLARILPYTRLVAREVANADSCGEASRVRLFIANVAYANRKQSRSHYDDRRHRPGRGAAHRTRCVVAGPACVTRA